MAAQGNKLERVMERVQLLLARADHPGTPPHEADTARNMADALMFRYKIDTLTQRDESAPKFEPTWARIIVCEASNEFSAHYTSIVDAIVRHNSLRLHWGVEWNDDGTGTQRRYYVAHVVGFEGDVRYCELMVSSALVAFGKALEPKFNYDETHAQNALRLRRGGMERHRIARLLFGDSETVNEQKAKNRKVTRLIKEEAARIGEPHLAEEVLGRGTSIKTFRASYAHGFYSTLVNRLRQMSIERGQNADGVVVLASLKESIDEAFYERYPNQRPHTTRDDRTLGNAQEECQKCKAAKSGFCREHSWKRPRRAKTTAFSNSAFNSGSAAARTVDLGSTRKGIGDN